ncbi:hypothetical protein AcV5_007923 [Taiwanofungus camphoratus]|nr:hypothetical protein AcV7_006075 [Antrodia cinnamomea]KAI0927370.1 hypothetical protein AcV5_007923 [Antrodia cinnamomea]
MKLQPIDYIAILFGQLTEEWKDQLQLATTDPEHIFNVPTWMARVTLDIIGKRRSIISGVLDEERNEVVEVYRNMFADSLLYSSKATLLFWWLCPNIPHRSLRYSVDIPTREHTRLRNAFTAINRVYAKLVEEKTETFLAGNAENKRDIMTILAKANTSEDSKSRLSDIEMISQMGTVLQGGHEMTASSHLDSLGASQEYAISAQDA